MAKGWAKPFYKSRAWRIMRAEILRRDLYTCEECGARATEVHHEIELTPENIGDPNIALNPDLLHSLCHDCHTAITQGTADCDEEFFFDADGQLTPQGGLYTEVGSGDREGSTRKHARRARARGGAHD